MSIPSKENYTINELIDYLGVNGFRMRGCVDGVVMLGYVRREPTLEFKAEWIKYDNPTVIYQADQVHSMVARMAADAELEHAKLAIVRDDARMRKVKDEITAFGMVVREQEGLDDAVLMYCQDDRVVFWTDFDYILGELVANPKKTVTEILSEMLASSISTK